MKSATKNLIEKITTGKPDSPTQIHHWLLPEFASNRHVLETLPRNKIIYVVHELYLHCQERAMMSTVENLGTVPSQSTIAKKSKLINPKLNK